MPAYNPVLLMSFVSTSSGPYIISPVVSDLALVVTAGKFSIELPHAIGSFRKVWVKNRSKEQISIECFAGDFIDDDAVLILSHNDALHLVDFSVGIWVVF